MAHNTTNAAQQKYRDNQPELEKAMPEVTPESSQASAKAAGAAAQSAMPETEAQKGGDKILNAALEKMHIGGKTTKPNQKLRKGEKVDAGIPEVERHQRTPNQADKINPPVRLKWDGSGEDTFTTVKKTGTKNLPLGSTVQPAPATSSSISPDGIVKRDKNKRFSF